MTREGRTLTDQLSAHLYGRKESQFTVQPVSQAEIVILGDQPADLFSGVQKILLRWIHDRAGRPLPDEAWDGQTFALEDVGAQRTEAVAIAEPRYWSARLDDSDRAVAQRSWVSEIGLAESSDRVVLGARLHCVTRGASEPFQPSLPRFVKTIVREFAGSVLIDGHKTSMSPWLVDSGEADRLCQLIERRDRRLDVIVCSLPEGSKNPEECLIDFVGLHRQVLGAAHVAVVSQDASYALTDAYGKELSVFRGAVRSYRPNFDSTQDEPYRHPLGLPHRIANWEGGGPDAYMNFIAREAILRSARAPDAERRLPSFAEAKRTATQLRRQAAQSVDSTTSELLELAETEIQELRDTAAEQKQTYDGLLQQAELERQEALEEAQQARSQLYGLKQRLEKLEKAAPAHGEPTIPGDLEGLEAWAYENLSGSVELHNRALQGAKKSQYEEPGFVYQALLLLRDYYVPMRRNGGLGSKETFESRCRELGISEEPTFSGDRHGEEGDTYLVRYAGRKCLLDRHLKKGNSREERYCFRLYFFWDEGTQQAVVGWLPSHLATRIS